MSEHIVVAQPVDDDGLRRVRDLVGPARVDHIAPYGAGDRLPGALARTATVLFADQLPAGVEDLTALRWLQLGSAGFAQVAGAPLRPDVAVTNASGVNDIPIAEWCLLMMLTLRRRLPAMLAEQRARSWNRAAAFQAELRGGRVGFVGYGNVGQEAARLARSAGLEIWTLTRSAPGPRTGRFDPLDRPASDWPEPDRAFGFDRGAEFYAGLDYLVVATPSTSSTRGLVDAAALAALPSHAVLLNPARAHVVDESALREALNSGAIAGAALDVHYRSPLTADDPVWDLPNTVITPHVSGSTGSTYFLPRLWELFHRNLARHLAGEPLLNLIDPADLELGR
ncbi:NAD(P)-dependent oxidoreductase [Jiangella sp. DSM 45060]|uniref:NAD(P)-dependent oxidoreductase n=1 Tax=Jiangella sp. DSM 45060 TaxID=1798224 RepID=UPI00087D28A3|nr:NAD(P)-dependent oxidoreductase [Jiangella sp. DSM 45060]SDT44170.1 Phosphoglycerate dehydrogenase [Jiangella sp. DSM 45060]